MKQADKEKTYLSWKEQREPLVLERYADFITGVIEKENEIPAMHKLCITGTMDSVLLGVNPWKTRQQLFNEMLFIKDEDIEDDRKFTFALGHAAEPLIAKEFSRLTHTRVKSGVTMVAPDRIWSAAQIDYLTVDNVPMECKTASHADGWGTGSLFNSNGVLIHADTKIPEYYRIQCQKQLMLSGMSSMFLSSWMTFDRGIRIFIVNEDKELQQKIIAAEDDFLFNHLIPEVPFEEDQELTAAPADKKENSCFANEEFQKLLARYKELKAPYLSVPTAVRKEMNDIQARLKNMMGDARYCIDTDGNELCHFTTSQGKPFFDEARFADEHPDLYSQYMSEGKFSTKFFIAKGKKK